MKLTSDMIKDDDVFIEIVEENGNENEIWFTFVKKEGNEYQLETPRS